MWRQNILFTTTFLHLQIFMYSGWWCTFFAFFHHSMWNFMFAILIWRRLFMASIITLLVSANFYWIAFSQNWKSIVKFNLEWYIFELWNKLCIIILKIFNKIYNARLKRKNWLNVFQVCHNILSAELAILAQKCRRMSDRFLFTRT